MAYQVTVRGLEGIQEFREADTTVRRVAAQTVNQVTRDTRATAARRILQQTNLPRSYVAPRNERLAVFKKASPRRLEAGIRARGRATSLARFVVGRPRLYKPGLTVAVRPGRSVYLRRAFLVRLRRGATTTDTAFNAGLAIRLPRGEHPAGSTRAVELSRGLFLLYGPSVAQIFLDNANTGVARDLEDPTAVKLQEEFLRRLAARGF